TGDAITLVAQVANAGPDAATDVEVRFTLPGQLEFVSAAPADWTCSVATGTLVCALADGLDNGADAPPLSVVATAVSVVDITVDVAAQVSGAVNDPVPAN